MLEFKTYKTEQDISGAYRITVDCGTESIVLKFREEPSEQLIRQTVLPIIEQRNATLSYEITKNNIVNTPVNQEEIFLMRRKHLDIIKSLCQLSGIEYTGKMTNIQYESILNNLSVTQYAGQASLLAVSLLYTRNVLRELDGENWWDNITGL